MPKPFGGRCIGGQLRGDKELGPFSGVTKSGRVWRKMPESEAQSVEEDAGKRCSECGGRCRKAVLGVWRKMPESDARSVEEGAGKRCSECGGRCRKAVLGVWDAA